MRPRTEGEPRPGRSRIAPPKTWADAVRAFLDHHRTRRRSELTLKWYAADLRRFAEWFEGENGEEPALGAIDGEALLDFQGHLASRPIATRDRATKQVTKRKP